MRHNVWLKSDEDSGWIEEMLRFSTPEELQEVVQATAWRLSQPMSVSTGSLGMCLQPIRAALRLKRGMEQILAEANLIEARASSL